MVFKNLCNRVLSFWFFLKICPKNWQNIQNFGHNPSHLQKQSKIQKSVRKISSYYIEVPNLSFLALFLMKKSVLARFWENRIFVKKHQNLPDSIKISQCFAFEPIKSPNSINNSYTTSYVKKRIWYENENSFKMYLWSCWSTFTMISIPKKSTNYWKTAKWPHGISPPSLRGG